MSGENFESVHADADVAQTLDHSFEDFFQLDVMADEHTASGWEVGLWVEECGASCMRWWEKACPSATSSCPTRDITIGHARAFSMQLRR